MSFRDKTPKLMNSNRKDKIFPKDTLRGLTKLVDTHISKNIRVENNLKIENVNRRIDVKKIVTMIHTYSLRFLHYLIKHNEITYELATLHIDFPASRKLSQKTLEKLWSMLGS